MSSLSTRPIGIVSKGPDTVVFSFSSHIIKGLRNDWSYVKAILENRKIEGKTGFEHMTSAILVQWTSNWAIKLTGSWSHCEILRYTAEKDMRTWSSIKYLIVHIFTCIIKGRLWLSAWKISLGTIWIWSTCYLSKNCTEPFLSRKNDVFISSKTTATFFRRGIAVSAGTFIKTFQI